MLYYTVLAEQLARGTGLVVGHHVPVAPPLRGGLEPRILSSITIITTIIRMITITRIITILNNNNNIIIIIIINRIIAKSKPRQRLPGVVLRGHQVAPEEGRLVLLPLPLLLLLPIIIIIMRHIIIIIMIILIIAIVLLLLLRLLRLILLSTKY